VSTDPAIPADLTDLTYEQARDELITIVAQLESGQVPLEQSMSLWHRGEALAAYCARWLDDAQSQIADAGVVMRIRDEQD
jgi:exodeoxyribonuclease VII small subunit